eukprot:jgi/Orpsp1_1/1178412/evm.model.c7180000065174.2
MSKVQYIDELKNSLNRDEVKNNINFPVVQEDYYECEINDFENFINNRNDRNVTFNSCNHNWNILLVSQGQIINENDHFYVLLQNDDHRSIEHIYVKIIISFRNSSNFSKYKSFDVSSLYCFSNTKNDIRDTGYEYCINKKGYEEIKPLVMDNKITLGIYLRIYNTNNRLDQYINNVKNVINKEEYEVKYESYYEYAMDYYSVIYDTVYSQDFKIGDYIWELSLHNLYPNDNEYINLKLDLCSELNNNFFIANCVFYIRNSNDYSCIKMNAYQTASHFVDKFDSIEFKEFIKRDDLFRKIDNLNKPLLENNKVVFGVYIQIYEIDTCKINIKFF